MTPSPSHDRQGFEIAFICVLQVEAEAVHAVFNKFWGDEGKVYDKVQGDYNFYTEGVIGEHNVVLAYLPGMGKVNAADVAASFRSSFVGIKLALIVGLCGGASYATDEKDEIHLGDIIISTAVIQYDFGRQYPKLFELKDTFWISSVACKWRTHTGLWCVLS